MRKLRASQNTSKASKPEPMRVSSSAIRVHQEIEVSDQDSSVSDDNDAFDNNKSIGSSKVIQYRAEEPRPSD